MALKYLVNLGGQKMQTILFPCQTRVRPSKFLVTGCRLYAVAGCGQLDSVEYLELESGGGQPSPAGSRFEQPGGHVEASNWQPACPMACPRHLPGVR